ncbi:MAG: 5'-nucleotidase, lipoprotein e(P4) family [Bacteroidetes bacterium]|nr:5'-nucleotidase, lipoprotein e(P4) family [Bacteroidota bacterium]
MKKIKLISSDCHNSRVAVILLLVVFNSCTIAPRISVNTPLQDQAIVNGKLFSTAYQQKAAEYRGLCYQAYNIARMRVDEFAQTTTALPKAIMTDIDETVLNNSPYQARQLLMGKDYEAESWKQWTDKGIADTVPGAVHFFQYAASKGITVFYVSNRNDNERVATLRNLQRYNFPYADNDHLLLVTSVSSKEPRREVIRKNYTIMMYVGDNANDLSVLFEKKNTDDRKKVADDYSTYFGKQFIILPNPVYGDWEFSIYNYNYKLTPAQKDSVIRATMDTY